MSRDLKQALSTYVPGREIVVDKKTYESYGVFFKFPGDQNDRATGVEWDELNWLNWCDRCETSTTTRTRTWLNRPQLLGLW